VRREPYSYPGYVVARIWLGGEGGGAARLDVRLRFDDPWLNYGEMLTTVAATPERLDEIFDLRPVTPGIVASIIGQALSHGWNPKARGSTLAARWNGGVLEIPLG
jgi:hypothetical protein